MPPTDNLPPTAVITGHSVATVGVPFTVDISESSDPEGKLQKWRVDWPDGESEGGVWPPDAPIEHVFGAPLEAVDVVVTVSDHKKLRASAALTINVKTAGETPQDCVLSDWRMESAGPWSECNPNGTQQRSEIWVRDVVTPPSNGGMECGPQEDLRLGEQSCTYVPPPGPNVDCVLSDWRRESSTPFGPCQPSGTQSRTSVWVRDITTQPSGEGKPCGPTREERTETQPCVYVPPSGNRHVHFERMLSHSQIWKSRAYRSEPDFIAPNGKRAHPWFMLDTEKEAMKVFLPPWQPSQAGVLAADINATQDQIPINPPPDGTKNHAYLIDDAVDEVVEQQVKNGVVLSWQRGQYGTTPGTHKAGSPVYRGIASMPLNGPDVQLDSGLGNTYLFGWDNMVNDPMNRWPLKTWHFFVYDGTVWLEIRHNDPGGSGYLGTNVRIYGVDGPQEPRVGTFIPVAMRPKRLFVWIDLKSTPPVFSMWVGDVVQGIIQVYNKATLRTIGSRGIQRFDIEYNTSSHNTQPELKDRISWDWDWYALRDVSLADVQGLLSLDGLPAAL